MTIDPSLLLSPGVYELTEDVENPRPDRRRTRDWECVPTWRAGLTVVVRSTAYSDALHYGASRSEARERYAANAPYALEMKSTIGQYPDAIRPADPRWAALVPKLKRLPDTVDVAMGTDGISATELVDALVYTDQLTVGAVRLAVAARNAGREIESRLAEIIFGDPHAPSNAAQEKRIGEIACEIERREGKRLFTLVPFGLDPFTLRDAADVVAEGLAEKYPDLCDTLEARAAKRCAAPAGQDCVPKCVPCAARAELKARNAATAKPTLSGSMRPFVMSETRARIAACTNCHGAGWRNGNACSCNPHCLLPEGESKKLAGTSIGAALLGGES